MRSKGLAAETASDGEPRRAEDRLENIELRTSVIGTFDRYNCSASSRTAAVWATT